MNCVELFAGAGGASLGLRRAGFRPVMQVEWDADACATLRAAGFEGVFEGDVRQADVSALGPVDLLWCSPPCQPFSNMGKKLGSTDERDGWPWALGVIDRMPSKPKWVLCENVVGLTQHNEGCTDDCRGCHWKRVVDEFRSRYACVDYRILDAADYGVPQHRERVVLVAGPRPFPWPAPSHSRRALLHAKWVMHTYWSERGLARPEVGPSLPETRALTPAVVFGPPPPERPWVTVRDALGLERALRVEATSAVSRSVDEVSPTVSTKGNMYTHPRAGEARTGRNGIRSAPPGERRRITYQETAILQGFPPDHPFQGDVASRHKQAGNAVPPPLAEALGVALRGALA